MNIRPCCKKLLKRYSDHQRSVICKNWILPIRLAVISSLFGHLIWRAYHPVVFYTAIIIVIHCTVALLLLGECRRSEQYHRSLELYERRRKEYMG